MLETFIDHADLGAPRVTACINAVIKLYPGDSKAALARYFEAVHQELVPLARELEREIADLKHDIERSLAIASEQASRIIELEEALVSSRATALEEAAKLVENEYGFHNIADAVRALKQDREMNDG